MYRGEYSCKLLYNVIKLKDNHTFIFHLQIQKDVKHFQPRMMMCPYYQVCYVLSELPTIWI